MYKRTLTSLLRRSKRSVHLLGPRQTGKSTLLRGLDPDLAINLAGEAEFLRFSSDPSRLEAVLAAERPRTVFIDEVQRLPSLLNTLQKVIDESPGAHRFFLSGSSARKLRRGRANLLPGRVISYEMGPLTTIEIGPEANLTELLSFGSLPGVLTEKTRAVRRQILRSYAATYLKEEIQAEALTRDIEGFSRFLFVAAAKNGEFVDYAKLGSQAGITQKTASRFFEILEDTLIIHRLNAFAGTETRRLIQHPKFYFFDTGVLNGLLGNFTPSADRVGALFETLVYNQLANTARALGCAARFSTYRTNKNVEVDLIVEIEDEVWAVEIKASPNVGPSDLRGLKSFLEIEPRAKSFVVYTGEQRLRKDGVVIQSLPAMVTALTAWIKRKE